MAIPLPPTIARFIDASNARDLDAAVVCFAAGAVVEDEGETHRGLGEVQAWKQATEDRYRYMIDPTGIDQREGLAVVRATLAGNFPGSPVELVYEFTLVDDAIESLKIHPRQSNARVSDHRRDPGDPRWLDGSPARAQVL
jgi:hypothetical protein